MPANSVAWMQCGLPRLFGRFVMMHEMTRENGDALRDVRRL